jgi:hypothetical protein
VISLFEERQKHTKVGNSPQSDSSVAALFKKTTSLVSRLLTYIGHFIFVFWDLIVNQYIIKYYTAAGRS